ncbi:MAG: putative bifunctional diguanylate cyclase/phosphodiesterase [Ilumatobacteraceae bacterium]
MPDESPFRTPASGSPPDVGLFDTDASGRLTFGDDRFRSVALGGAVPPIGRAPWANARPDDRMAAEHVWRQANGGPADITVPIGLPDGTERRVRFLLTPRLDSDGSVVGFTGVALRVDEQRASYGPWLAGLEALIATTDDIVIVADANDNVTFANEAADAFPQLRTVVHDQMPRDLAKGAITLWRGEVGLRGSDDDIHTFDIQVHRSSSGTALIARDITASTKLQAALAHQATHDGLTSLPNRTLFIRKLSEAIERARATRAMVAVFFLDIDKLKDVNDSAGHENGDMLIANIGKRLVAATRPGDIVGRIGGDEFVILCEGLTDEEAALDLAERVRLAITGRVLLHGVEVTTGASLGVAVTRGESGEPVLADAAIALMRNADTAMYHAKLRGRSRCELYTENMRETARERATLSSALERALANDELRLVYQPIHSPHTDRVVGAEALLRWHHPTLGILTPSVFVDLAEESGIIAPIGEWVMNRACADLRDWLNASRVDRQFVVHVNVSPRQVSDPRFVERSLAALKEHDLQPQHLALEFDERMLMRDPTTALRTLQSLRRFGVRLSIDDFGTGYSSLSQLRSCPADYLKLDGSFVRSLGDEDRDDPIVRSIIQLAHSLDMAVIAEWVTTDAQMTRLRAMGCDLLQGYRIGRPVSAADFGHTGPMSQLPGDGLPFS